MYGLYSAIVIRNDHFFESGTIRIKIFNWYLAPNYVNGEVQNIDDISTSEFLAKRDGNLSESGFEDIDNVTNEDFEALLFSPLGGGKNYGLFTLPQVNTKGVVAFLDLEFEKPIWLGGYFNPIKDENFKTIGVNIPTDRPDQEGEDTNGAKDGKKEIDGNEGTIIFRGKRTWHNEGDSSDLIPLSFDNVRTDNLIVIDNENLVRLRHFTKYKPKEGGMDYETEPKSLHWQDFTIDRGDTGVEEYDGQETDPKNGLERLTFTIYNEENMRTNTFQINEGKTHFRIENKPDGPEKKGTKSKEDRYFDIYYDQGKLHIITEWKKNVDGEDVKKKHEVIIDEDQLYSDIKDDKNKKRHTTTKDIRQIHNDIKNDKDNKRHITTIDEDQFHTEVQDNNTSKIHFSTMTVDELHSKITVPGKTNETKIEGGKTYNSVKGSSGTTTYHFSGNDASALSYIDYHGHSIEAGPSGINLVSGFGTKVEIGTADVKINGPNFKVLL